MNDRVSGMIGTLGLALLVSALLPTTNAWAWGSSGCDGSCREATLNERKCTGNCSGTVNGNTCGCPPQKEENACPCDATTPGGGLA
ncbi:hypothetical protein CA85_41900 [Allorhodopirellula solitaria]|uniref:Uncharacterized protein n=1 Tax=Allorhodopirellula solitaria TaxID=2527987 RepID=A0A5C5X063_9BACT|nr:hypothetical protein CA85_41900 [Allorhodopirellula solitaria]